MTEEKGDKVLKYVGKIDKKINKNPIVEKVKGTKELITSTSAATITIAFAALVMSLTGKFPSGVPISMFLFLSLPLLFIALAFFIFSKPVTAKDLSTRLGFISATVISIVLYLLLMKPDSWSSFGWAMLYFFGGFSLAFLCGSVYLIMFFLLKKQIFRWRYLISLIISLIFTLSIAYFIFILLGIEGV